MSNVQDITASHWTILREEFRDPSTVGSEVRSFKHTGTIANDTSNTTSIITVKMDDTENYVDMSKAVLYMKAKVVKAADGSAYDADSVITTASNIQMAFKNLELRIGGQTVHQINDPGYASTVRHLAQMSRDYADSLSELEMWTPEHVNHRIGTLANPNADTTITRLSGIAQPRRKVVAAEADLASFNPAFLKRFKRTQESKSFDVMIPLQRLFPYFASFTGVTKGLIYEILLTRNTEWQEVLHSRLNGNLADDAPIDPGKLLIQEVTLWVPSLQPSIQTVSYLEEQLGSGVISKVLYENWTTYISGEYEAVAASFRDITTTRKPLMAFVMLQGSGAYTNQADQDTVANLENGAQENSSNPLQFRAGIPGDFGYNDISSISVFVNNKRYPTENYETDYTNDLYARAYSDYLACIGKTPMDGEDSSIVTWEDYKYQYNIWAFDLRKMPPASAGSVFHIEVRAQVSTSNRVAQSKYRMIVALATEEELLLGGLDGRLLVDA